MGSTVLTMEQGAVLQQQLPIHDYSLSSDHDYSNQFSNHATHHPSYAAAGAPVDLGRDGSTMLQPPAPFAFTATNGTNGTRFIPDRGIASDNSSYQTSNNFTDSSSSPSSAASSLAYTSYQQNHCTSIPSFPGSVQLPQAFVHAPYASVRVPSNPILESAGSGMLPPPNPIRASISSVTNTTDPDQYADSFLSRTQLSPGSHSGYGPYQDTTRSAVSISGLSLSNPSSNYANGHGQRHMASGFNQQNDCGNFPWPTLEIHAEMTCEGRAVTPEVHAKVEKGFFRSTVDGKWTCYRRNYFSVQCSFELHPSIDNGRMCLKRSSSTQSEHIQAMGMRLTAAVDGSSGKMVDLVQHTPKRDNGPKIKIEVQKVSPTPSTGRSDSTVSPHGIYQVPLSTFIPTGQVSGPFLPLQNQTDQTTSGTDAQTTQVSNGYGYTSTSGSHLPLPGQSTLHTFERIQFKQATANNGKRRASQQYFHLIVELFADVRPENGEKPIWVKIAHRVSDKIVVRGRSPSHYQNEGPHGTGRTGSSGGGSSYSAIGGPNYGGLSSGGFRSSSSSYGGGMTSASYRSTAYGLHSSPKHSGSSASSVAGGAQDSDYSGDTIMSEAERNEIQAHEGYRYYPGPIYEGISQGGLPLPKIESTARFSTDPSCWAVKSEYNEAAIPGVGQWPVAGISRFQGVESSRGYFPDLAVNYS